MSIKMRPLGYVRQVVEEMGYEITYAYDDLIFISHSAFLLRFGEELRILYLYFNRECRPADAEKLSAKVIKAFGDAGFFVDVRGRYSMEQKEGENLQLIFHDMPISIDLRNN